MMATPHHWQRMKELIDQALDLSATERRSYLDQACGDDEALRFEIDGLLDREDRLGGFLAQPYFSLRAGSEADLALQLGPYRLVRRIGAGGMGTVYLAERVDGELRQQVAVKLLKRGLDSEEMVRRFQMERQILADLSHPYVARLLEVGTAEDGRPFFAMEYVDGQRIDTWCAAQKLSIRQRVALFRQVCEAIHFAHQNLVVHRDLKPANILITAGGIPKLLDFGVAKLLDRKAGSTSLTSPRGSAPLSLFYSSPEQLTGGSITTASDVYALGVILYELLTGHRPHRLDGLRPEAAAQVLLREEPIKPSLAAARPVPRQPLNNHRGGHFAEATTSTSCTVTPEPGRAADRDQDQGQASPHGGSSQLRGDLDNIILKALTPEPARRFSSAEQLSEELRRYLEGLPVRSRPDTFLYRTGKFMRRNALGVATAVFIAFLVLGFGIAMAIQSQTIAHQMQEIALERDSAEGITEFLVSFLKSLDPSRAGDEAVTPREALTMAVAQLEKELASEPEIRARLMDALGGVYRSLDVRGEARLLFEEALRLRRQTYGAKHALVAETMHNLAGLEKDEENGEKAEDLMRRAIEIQRRSFPDGDRDLARGLNNLALLLRSQGRGLAEAEALLRESIEMKERLFGPGDRELLKPLSSLASLLRGQGKFTEAETLYRRCLVLRRRFEGAMSPGVAKTENFLAGLLVARGDWAGAKVLYENVLKIRRQLDDGDEEELISSLSNLGRVYLLLGEFGASEASLEEGVEKTRRLEASEAADPLLVALVERNLAWAQLELGKFQACEILARSALVEFRQREKARWLAETESILGGCLAGQKRFQEARALLSKGYGGLLETVGLEALETAHARKRLEALGSNQSRGPAT